MRFVGSSLIIFVGSFIVTYNTTIMKGVNVADDNVLKNAEDTLWSTHGTIIFTCMVRHISAFECYSYFDGIS
jgi:hypothetical protein